MGKDIKGYENIPTSIPGVELRVLAGAKVEAPDEIIQFFLELAKRFAMAKEEITAQTARQKERREKLIKYVKSLPGLRGIRSVPDDFGLLAVKKEKTFWDPGLLRASLGVAYDSIVGEDLVATITIPPKLTTEEELRQGLMELLQKLEVPAEDVSKILETDIQLRIDVEKLEELIEAGRVKLLAGTKEVDEDWAIEAEPLKTPQKKAEKKKEKREAAPS